MIFHASSGPASYLATRSPFLFFLVPFPCSDLHFTKIVGSPVNIFHQGEDFAGKVLFCVHNLLVKSCLLAEPGIWLLWVSCCGLHAMSWTVFGCSGLVVTSGSLFCCYGSIGLGCSCCCGLVVVLWPLWAGCCVSLGGRYESL